MGGQACKTYEHQQVSFVMLIMRCLAYHFSLNESIQKSLYFLLNYICKDNSFIGWVTVLVMWIACKSSLLLASVEMQNLWSQEFTVMQKDLKIRLCYQSQSHISSLRKQTLSSKVITSSLQQFFFPEKSSMVWVRDDEMDCLLTSTNSLSTTLICVLCCENTSTTNFFNSAALSTKAF